MTYPGTHYDYSSVYVDFTNANADSRYITMHPDATPEAKAYAVAAVAHYVSQGYSPARIQQELKLMPIR